MAGARANAWKNSTPTVQARMIVEALDKLGVGPSIVVVHSLAGAIGARLALDYPSRVAGLVMLAPVTHPWRGGVSWYNKLIAKPVIGPLLAYTDHPAARTPCCGVGGAKRVRTADHAR